ncbi:hypothetical protein [Hyphobacterium marinum]|uniref:Glycosyltransferase subfamily 4-like N-terminal domain-containing protein n=1 Tax=Hyphobacterium marinum TaxID=3116574 RepID=A0ABU7LY75_9PROT|nr:hypothetical protein [Hyphobacterium sp. Y6023]MEE2566484.1 hypothetical protein [Hyphobacterium sp. Y6023]
MRVLLIARHFPPAVTGGARRPYLWAKGLEANGVEVFTVAPDIPADLTGSAEPHAFRDPSTALPGKPGLRDHARNLLLWPDPDIRWTRRAARLASETCPFTPDWIITTSPPESVHAAGPLLLKHWPDARWAVDARDHWLVRPFRKQRDNPVRRAIEARQARAMLARASAVFAVNDLIAKEYAGYAPHAKTGVLAHFVMPAAEPYAFEGPGPHLVHTGSFKMSDPDVSIDPLLTAFEAAHARKPELRLHLAGRLREDEAARIEASPASDAIILHGVVPLETALAMQAGADALLVAAAPNAPVPPGKYAEYRASGAAIIPVGDGPWRPAIDRDDRPDAERLLAVRPGRQDRREPDATDHVMAMAGVIDTLNALNG